MPLERSLGLLPRGLQSRSEQLADQGMLLVEARGKPVCCLCSECGSGGIWQLVRDLQSRGSWCRFCARGEGMLVKLHLDLQ